MLRMNPARAFRSLAAMIGLGALVNTAPAAPAEVGHLLPRGEGPPARRPRPKRAHRANRRRLKGQRNALCHHTRWTVRRGTLRKTHTAWAQGGRKGQEG
jgi:hypothetical protein